MLASDYKTWTNTAQHGDADVVLDTRSNTPGPCYKCGGAKMMGEARITEKMNEVGLHWYGHVLRNTENLVAKTSLYLNLKGRQPGGQPKKHWMDRVTEDM